MNHLSNDMHACIQECLKCHTTCLSAAMNHCLEAGGPHTEPEHFRLMIACAEMCRTAAAVMAIGTALHKETCRACAEFCTRCAESCAALDGMEDCAEQCRPCARHCSAMAA